MKTTELKQLALTALEDLKANDIRVIDVEGKTIITDILIIATGTSTRHNKALAHSVAQAAKDGGNQPLGIEGDLTPEWMLVDLGDVVVHVMTQETRDYYDLERLWVDDDAQDQIKVDERAKSTDDLEAANDGE